MKQPTSEGSSPGGAGRPEARPAACDGNRSPHRLAFGLSLSDDDRARVALCCERGACALYSETGAWLAGGEAGQGAFVTPARCRACRYREPCTLGRRTLL